MKTVKPGVLTAQPAVSPVVPREGAATADARLAHRYVRYEARLNDLEKRAGTLIEPIGVCPLPSGVEVVHTPLDVAYDWAFCLLDNDPVYREGQLHIPAHVQRKLRHLDELGVCFDTLVIGHEVDKALAHSLAGGGNSGQQKLLASTAGTGAPPRSVVWTNAAARVLVGTACAFASAAAALPAALAADPVLLGAVTVDGTTEPQTPAALFLLAAWS